MANALKYQWTPEEAVEKLYQKGFLDGSNQGFLQTLIDNTIEIQENSFFWQEHFRVEGNEYDIDIADLKKNPAWTVRQQINRTLMQKALVKRRVLYTSMVRACLRHQCLSSSLLHVLQNSVQTKILS